MTPRVSVCIAAYNAAPFLATTLDALWGQDFEDFEVVVVDDASTDGTSEVLVTETDRRLRYVRLPQNRGQARANDEALDRAQGEFIKFLDADDLLEPTCLRKMVRELDAYPGASFVFCRRNIEVEEDARERSEEWISLHGNPAARFERVDAINSGSELLEQWITAGLGNNWIAEPAGVMARRSSLERVGGYSRRTKLVIDMDLWARLMTCGDVAYVDEPLFTYKLSDHGVTGHAIATNEQWLDSLWSAEGLLALPDPPCPALLRAKRRELLSHAIHLAGSDIRSIPPKVHKLGSLGSYARYRASLAVGRRPPIYKFPRPIAPRVE